MKPEEIKILIEILKDVKQNKDSLDKLLFQLETLETALLVQEPVNSTVEDVNDVQIPLNDEIYYNLCKELGSGRIFFMAIA
tara:strand:+ start:1084 stop:1326 length:243 start_codon:yes stop_codon:yes gene_type:complete